MSMSFCFCCAMHVGLSLVSSLLIRFSGYCFSVDDAHHLLASSTTACERTTDWPRAGQGTRGDKHFDPHDGSDGAAGPESQRKLALPVWETMCAETEPAKSKILCTYRPCLPVLSPLSLLHPFFSSAGWGEVAFGFPSGGAQKVPRGCQFPLTDGIARSRHNDVRILLRPHKW